MTLHRARAAQATAGFTLVELLVAITLLGLLTGLLFGGFRFGTRAAGAVGSRIDQSSQIAILYDFMQNELTDARILPASSDATAPPASFEGQPDAMSFVTTPPAYLALGGFHLLHIGIEGDGPARRLVVSWQQVPRGALPDQPSNLQPSVLLEKVRSVQFGYFGLADPNRPPEWLDRWIDRPELPQLVRLRITLGDGWQAPDLIIAPRLAGAAQS